MAEYAIFMAIITTTNCPRRYWLGAGVEQGVLTFTATAATLAQLTPAASGWVYVFARQHFTLRDEGGVEYVAYVPVVPVTRVRVTQADLPAITVRER